MVCGPFEGCGGGGGGSTGVNMAYVHCVYSIVGAGSREGRVPLSERSLRKGKGWLK